ARRLSLQLNAKWRSVRANAPDQFSKRSCAGRSGIERDKAEENFGRREDNETGKHKIDRDKIDNRASRSFRQSRNDCAQDFAARLSARIFLLLRFGGMRMERTFAFYRCILRNRHGEHAMIRNREPR